MLGKMTNHEQETTSVTSKVCRFCPPLSMLGRFPKKAGARAVRPGPEWWDQWWESEVGLPELVNTFESRSGLRWRGSLHVTTPLAEFAYDELLSQTGADSFRGSDCEISKDKANATIRF